MVLDHLSDEAIQERIDLIKDHYASRREGLDAGFEQGVPYKPIDPNLLYLNKEDWAGQIGTQTRIRLSPPFDVPDSSLETIVNLGGKQGRTFAAERSADNVNVFDAVIDHIAALKADKKTRHHCMLDAGGVGRTHASGSHRSWHDRTGAV